MNAPERIFDLLDTWRHHPAYQLERRADIFFALYLPEVLEKKFGVPFHPDLIPEFPIRIGSIEKGSNSNQSFKADYLAFSKSLDRAILVELKTEMNSIRPEQNDYLLNAKNAGMETLLNGLMHVYLATSAKDKYWQLIKRLSDIGILDITGVGTATPYAASPPVELQFGNNVVLLKKPRIDVVYVQPVYPENVITFDHFRDVVMLHHDEFSIRFADSLKRWATVKAGSPME